MWTKWIAVFPGAIRAAVATAVFLAVWAFLTSVVLAVLTPSVQLGPNFASSLIFVSIATALAVLSIRVVLRAVRSTSGGSGKAGRLVATLYMLVIAAFLAPTVGRLLSEQTSGGMLSQAAASHFLVSDPVGLPSSRVERTMAELEKARSSFSALWGIADDDGPVPVQL